MSDPVSDHDLHATCPPGDLIAVEVKPGLIVWHTPEEYAKLMAGVDMEAAKALTEEEK